MSQDTPKRCNIPVRIKNMMSLIRGVGTETTALKRNSPSSSRPLVPDSASTSTSQVISKPTYFNMNHVDLVNYLYSQPYSMTSSVFDTFKETQNSNNPADLKNTNKIINEFPSHSYLIRKESDLHCQEAMPPSPDPLLTETLDFDSDDSVKDRDYQPSNDDYSSDDTEKGYTQIRARKITRNLELFTIKTPLRRHSTSYTNKNLPANSLPSKRRITVDGSYSECTPVHSEPQRKRRKHSKSLKERKIEKQNEHRQKYQVKEGCSVKCTKKCCANFTSDDRVYANKTYWAMSRSEQRVFIRSMYTVNIPKRKYVSEPKRNPKRNFTLPKKDGTLAHVCKIFFLTTLGFEKSNDKILFNALDSSKDTDCRGKHSKTPSFDREMLTNHIESFQPSAPHYRREHAPNRRYLPNDINIKFMFNDFCNKHPEAKISYDLYRNHLKTLNISFTRLGNEECEACETYRLHTLETKHDVRVQDFPDCNLCSSWKNHYSRYKKARELYDLHKNLGQDQQKIFFSADLEKVIMLPRLETFKAVIFCPRLVAYNQTFAPLGKITKELKPLAVIWHDGIAGRKQEEIMSAFHQFLLKHRDVETINLWLDNCAAQNKNWLLFSMLVDIINSDVIATINIKLYYFEPGHTFMSCDQFHHQVELAMKRRQKIYDFNDFEETVASANNAKVNVKSMQPTDFINFPNNVSERRIQNSNPRAYLKNMTQVSFKRGSFDLFYKNSFNEDFKCLKFLNDKYLKNPHLNYTFRTQPKGIDKDRKLNIITKLSSIIPKHKMLFWNNLPILEDNTPEVQNKRTPRGSI